MPTTMIPQEHYRSDNTTAAYSLRWSWAGWPSTGTFPSLDSNAWGTLHSLWEKDGIRVLERRCTDSQWQLTVSSRTNVVPSFIVARLKGRIDHAFRSSKSGFQFSRKVSLRSLGSNTEVEVQDYIANQVQKAGFCDPKFASQLSSFTRKWEPSDCAEAIVVTSGRYWFQLHLVLVVDHRHSIRDLQFLGRLFEEVQSIALDRRYRLSAVSVMPDHLHIGVRGVVEESPEAIALAFMNETCRSMKINPIWRPSYYVGTVGAYNMNAVRE